MKLKATIIDPYKRKSRVTCSTCDLSYTARNNRILYENEKVAFFKMKIPSQRLKIYCHDCLHDAVHNGMGPLKEIKLDMELIDHSVVLIFSR